MRKILSLVQRNTYRNKIIYYCSICVFVPCVLFAFIAIGLFFNAQKNDILKKSDALAEDAISTQENLSWNYRKLVSLFAQTEELINYFAKDGLEESYYEKLFANVEPNLNRLVNTNLDILDDILVFSANEEICQPEKQIYSMDVLRELECGKGFLEERVQYRMSYDQEGTILPYLRISKKKNIKDAFVYLEKLFHVNGKQMCVLAFVISPDKMFSNNAVLESADGFVLCRNDKILKSKNLDSADFRTEDNWILAKDNLTGTEFYLKVDFSSLRNLTIMAICLFILTFFAIILLMYFVNRIISHLFGRLQDVVDSMEQIEFGEFHSHLVEDDKTDEVSMITHQFNRLLVHLEHNAKELLSREREKKDAEILALQYQMNPHFICNSMNIIQLAVEEKGCYQISDAIASFVSVLRYNISGNMDSTVGEELKSIREYIQFISFCRNVDIAITEETPEELKNCYMMKFLLQPVVENAVYHGYARSRDRTYQLIFRLYREDGHLHLEVENNGAVIEEKRLLELNKKMQEAAKEMEKDKRQSIGLLNIAYRMKLHFGSQVQVYITSEENRTVFHLCYPEIAMEKEDFT